MRNDLSRYLFQSARAEAPPEGALERTAARIAAAAGAVASTVVLAEATSLSKASGVFGSAAPHLALKWVLVGAVAGSVAVGASEWARHADPGAAGAARVLAHPVRAGLPEGPLVEFAAEPESRLLSVDPPALASTQPAAKVAAARRQPVLTKAPADEGNETPQAPPPATGASTIARELAILEQARGALAKRAPADALDAIGRYQDEFPAGHLSAEATALRVEALVQAGRRDEAARIARRFVATYPQSPLAPRVMTTAAIGEGDDP
jgi:TolA-binding protein